MGGPYIRIAFATSPGSPSPPRSATGRRRATARSRPAGSRRRPARRCWGRPGGRRTPRASRTVRCPPPARRSRRTAGAGCAAARRRGAWPPPARAATPPAAAAPAPRSWPHPLDVLASLPLGGQVQEYLLQVLLAEAGRHLGRRAVGDHPAARQEHHPPGDPPDLHHLVGWPQKRPPP